MHYTGFDHQYVTRCQLHSMRLSIARAARRDLAGGGVALSAPADRIDPMTSGDQIQIHAYVQAARTIANNVNWDWFQVSKLH